MASIKNRIEKLEKLQPSGLQHLSDEELNTRISELCNKLQINEWLADNNNHDLLQSRVIEIMTQYDNLLIK